MVTGRSPETIRYCPEKVNRPEGIVLTGASKNQNHMANWIDCICCRQTPNASVDIGYRSAIAAHMANIAYRRSEEHTSELQSHSDLVCRLLLEKKKKNNNK